MKRSSPKYLPWAVGLLFLVTFASSCTQKTKVKGTATSSTTASARQGDGLKLRSGDFGSLKAEDLSEYKVTTKAPFTHLLFGYIDPEDPEANFQVSSDVPFKVGMYYGWALRLRDGAGSSVQLEEVLTLPQPARVFRIHSGKSKVSDDGTEVKSTLNITAEDGWLFNFWQLTLGDPQGDYQMSLNYDAQPIVTFPFKVAR